MYNVIKVKNPEDRKKKRKRNINGYCFGCGLGQKLKIRRVRQSKRTKLKV